MKLKAWRKRERYSQARIGEMIGVTDMAVSRYERGQSPNSAVMRRIVKLTNGEVQPNDFYDLPEVSSDIGGVAATPTPNIIRGAG